MKYEQSLNCNKIPIWTNFKFDQNLNLNKFVVWTFESEQIRIWIEIRCVNKIPMWTNLKFVQIRIWTNIRRHAHPHESPTKSNGYVRRLISRRLIYIKSIYSACTHNTCLVGPVFWISVSLKFWNQQFFRNSLFKLHQSWHDLVRVWVVCAVSCHIVLTSGSCLLALLVQISQIENLR
jgi:hypothetical protein